MSQPTPYNRGALNGETYFTDWSAAHPTTPAGGQKYDQEYNAIALTLGQTLTNLALIQRDDGELANNSVGRDQLTADVVMGVGTPTTWATLTAYTVLDSVIHGTAWYWCAISHTSGVFATDLGAGDWELIYDFAAVFTTLLLSSATPADLGVAATAGVGTQASRADHIHKVLTSVVPTALGTPATVGNGTLAAREDHVHTIPNFDEGGTVLSSQVLAL